MELIPAIDIRDGRCVRLLKGDFDRETRYDVDPVALAQKYRDLGARWLHVVDLDGAAKGEPANLALIDTIRAASDVCVQFGGGIRDRGNLERALAVVDRVVIGSLAVTEPERVAAWLTEFGAERLALALDVRVDADGVAFIATHGWTRASELTLEQALQRYRIAGLRHVLCTDIDKDGALTGPNLELYADCVKRWPALALQASGGIRDLRDLTALAATGVAAAISGKALLEGRLTPAEIRPFLPNA
ncbi:MAG TPA: 1-(5-phosphoribosyl)-5-[(5-phosphoribosylamino)methylideneamino]imidazole-4-carboxamide isomerase [Gammaproteobacteria bacterium]|nr:1-(5-phosphoribosyl)-5-[(5-phosphoribosylamino)methylideneamino]imidazole-4-carboxamide isomerase [Gammaproteobacteria bacterium]